MKRFPTDEGFPLISLKTATSVFWMWTPVYCCFVHVGICCKMNGLYQYAEYQEGAVAPAPWRTIFVFDVLACPHRDLDCNARWNHFGSHALDKLVSQDMTNSSFKMSWMYLLSLHTLSVFHVLNLTCSGFSAVCFTFHPGLVSSLLEFQFWKSKSLKWTSIYIKK